VDSFDDLIARCLCREPAAEKRLYDRLAPVLLGLCRRYFANPEDAEDAMIQSLLTVFEKLPQFRYEGSFEGWARRIAVHTSLMALRKKKVDFSSAEDVASLEVPADFSLDSQDRTQAILACVQALPEGYRTVFNLFGGGILPRRNRRRVGDFRGHQQVPVFPSPRSLAVCFNR
jgi:RNA polymerase sigma-70 factor (ECF subfamily)